MLIKSFSIKQIPRGQNARVDALIKLASTSFDHLTNKVLVKVLLNKSIENKQFDIITTYLDWIKPFTYYVLYGVLQDDPTEARKVKVNVLQFEVRNTQLYKIG